MYGGKSIVREDSHYSSQHVNMTTESPCWTIISEHCEKESVRLTSGSDDFQLGFQETSIKLL